MEVSVDLPGFEGQKIVVKGPGIFNGQRLLVNGKIPRTSMWTGKFKLCRNDQTFVEGHWKSRWFDEPELIIDDEVVEYLEPRSTTEKVLLRAPAIIGIIGALSGIWMGRIFSRVILYVFRSNLSSARKYLLAVTLNIIAVAAIVVSQYFIFKLYQSTRSQQTPVRQVPVRAPRPQA